ncbi:hypothetical protein FRC17_009032 [Serendipita sp. 399]|nr:hypothetical protein FRC17_009032 [Serendipita sp. 399]
MADSLVDHPTTSWEALNNGAVFYSRRHLYQLQWNLSSMGGGGSDLSGYIVAGARFGGPVAIMRDNTKLIALGRTTFTKPVIQVFSSSGIHLATINWELSKIVSLGWTASEQLVVLNEDGQYRLYDLQGIYRSFSLGSEAAETGVIDARIFESGLVAITGQMSLLEVRGWEGQKPGTLHAPPMTGPPISWIVLPPDQTSSRHAEVVMAVEGTIYTCDNLEHIDQQMTSGGPFTHIAASPNGRSLALLTASSNLWVITSDFQRKILEFDLSTLSPSPPSSTPPNQIAWCGSDAVLIAYPTTVYLLGPGGETLFYPYGSTPVLVTEPDGTRVLTAIECEFVQRVPESLESVLRPGSIAPAAFLFDASESFAKREASSSSAANNSNAAGPGPGARDGVVLRGGGRADESIRAMKPDLAFAVDACIDAAGREWEVVWQKKLLNAAKFGRAFLDLFDPRPFVAMGQTLKVLNAIRYYEIGIPMTYQQYTLLSPEQLLSRLTSRSLHLLALRVANFLSLKPDSILKHWACAKIAQTRPSGGLGSAGGSGESDESVARGIIEKFEAMGAGAGSAGVSYAEIAKKAWESGRTGLATMLLDHETRAAEQVPLLLGMREDGRALEKAVDSGDTDLVYQVLLNLHKRLPLGDFFKLIEDGGPRVAPAAKLLQLYARDQNREMLRDFYYSDDRRVDSGLLLMEEASLQEDITARFNSTKAAQKFFSEDRERGFEAKMVEESAKLLALQQTLEKDVDGKSAFIGLSVSDTIMLCIQCGLNKRAERIRADWRVSDRQFWWLKLRALTEAKAWDELDAFSKYKKSPIGYEPFVRHLVGKGYGKQAVIYVAKCDPAKRGELYLSCGEYRAAAKEFSERGDRAGLSFSLIKLDSCPSRLQGFILSLNFRENTAFETIKEMEFVPPTLVHRVLCADCGTPIEPNSANLCMPCLRNTVDVTEGIPKSASLSFCRNCDRFLSPPATWTIAQPESRELLAICLKKLKGLNKVRLVDAGFIWTEPHSKRLRVKLTIQKEVFTSTIVEQVFEVEYVVQHGQCPDCTRLAAKNTWQAVIQVRQKVPHKRTFLFLEQLILKHNAHKDTVSIKEVKDGLDFYYAHESHAQKMTEFLASVVPVHPLTICSRVGNTIHLLDPSTLQETDVTSQVYWREPFFSLASVTDLVEFIVLDIEPSGTVRGKHVLADAEVAPSSSFASNSNSGMEMDMDSHHGSVSTTFHTRTHLGGILQPGDTVMGYWLTRSNFNSPAFESLDPSRIPDVILVKKSYPNQRKKNKQRNWKLKSMAKEAEEGAGINDSTSGYGRGALGRRGGLDQKRVEKDYELFLQSIEEDTEMRAAINLYKGKPVRTDTEMKAAKAPGPSKQERRGGQYAMEIEETSQTESETEGGEEADFPDVKLDELLDDFEEMGIQDEEGA